MDSLFIVDSTDLAKPYAKKLVLSEIEGMENTALVRDGDKRHFVTGYWCMEVYAQDVAGIIYPYSLQIEDQASLVFLSYLQSCNKGIRQRMNNKLRYCQQPKGSWFYRLFIALRDGFRIRAVMSLSAWCKPPP